MDYTHCLLILNFAFETRVNPFFFDENFDVKLLRKWNAELYKNPVFLFLILLFSSLFCSCEIVISSNIIVK